VTTVAYDGTTMASDSLASDNWGLRDSQIKIWHNENLLIGYAGEFGHLYAWRRRLDALDAVQTQTIEHLLDAGYPGYHKDDNNPQILIVNRADGRAYKLTHGQFTPINDHKFYSIGSGQDFARTAMHLGKTAREAIEIAFLFDNNTGGKILEVKR
jgi:ATP-dependent protease HslVU (ClpYQ) peptidase subunit